MLLSVCRSGLQDLKAYSLLGGGVPIPEHRLSRSLDSVPIFSLLRFPFSDGSGPPLSPLQDLPWFLALQFLLPVSSLLLPIASSLSVSVSSALHLHQRLSPVVSPSEVYNPTADCQPNTLLMVSCPEALRGFEPPPQTCAAGGTWIGCGWRGKGDGAPCNGLEFLDASTGLTRGSVLSSTLEVPLRFYWCPSLCLPPLPPYPYV